MLSSILLLLLTLALSAFFSGMEIAFVSANRLEAEVETNKKGTSSRLLRKALNEPAKFLATTLLGNNIALVIFGILFAKLVDPLLLPLLPLQGQEFWLLLADTLISTLVVLFLGEYIPKSIFRTNAVWLLRLFIIPFRLASIVLIIPVYMTLWISKLFIRLITGKAPEAEESVFTHFDLRDYIKSQLTETATDEAGEALAIDAEMFDKVLDLKTVKARECLVPRNEIIAIENTATIDEVRELFIEHKYSKIIVFEENIDQPLGYYYHQDILNNELVIHKPLLYPETTPADDILKDFMRNKRSIALIFDEYGGLAGLLTLEDVIEEIFGEIEDEYDFRNDEETEIQVNETTFRFSGRVEIDYLNEKYGFELPESDHYETLAGLLIDMVEAIPKKGKVVIIEETYRFTVEIATPTRIELVKMEVL